MPVTLQQKQEYLTLPVDRNHALFQIVTKSLCYKGEILAKVHHYFIQSHVVNLSTIDLGRL